MQLAAPKWVIDLSFCLPRCRLDQRVFGTRPWDAPKRIRLAYCRSSTQGLDGGCWVHGEYSRNPVMRGGGYYFRLCYTAIGPLFIVPLEAPMAINGTKHPDFNLPKEIKVSEDLLLLQFADDICR